MIELQRNAYIEEAHELLAELEDALLELERNSTDHELVGRIFRAMHTIKGSGAMFGFNKIAAFTHGIETVYDHIRDGRLAVSDHLISHTLKACDQIRLMLKDPDSDGDLQEKQRLEGIFGGFAAAETRGAPVSTAQVVRDDGLKTYRIRFKPNLEIFSNGTNPLPLLAELKAMGQCRVICHLDRLPDLAGMNPEACYVYWDVILSARAAETEIRDVFMFVDHLGELLIAEIDAGPDDGSDCSRLGDILVEKGDIGRDELERIAKAQPRIGELIVEAGVVASQKVESALAEQEQVRDLRRTEKTASVRVPSEKLDSLVNLVGELVITQARLTQLAERLDNSDLVVVAEEVERLSADLRDKTLGIRMLPIGTTFARFKRLVHDLADELGKQILFSTEGAETELDKTVIEKLGDPLMHLIRNSVDHGIESPAEREMRGKRPQGRICMTAEHAGSHVYITISDDGKGLDTAAIRRKAIEKGLIAADAVLPDRAVHELIFQPGFSTARTVSSISGRGVGMDVVARSIEGLGGQVEIESRTGQGSRFTLKLPLTLAIIDGLHVRIGADSFVIPLGNVVECMELDAGGARAKANGRHLARFREDLVPYVVLRDVFGFEEDRPALEQIVIAETNAGQIGFVVDRVVGQYQTVIKSLGSALKDVEGVSGATIMGDGTVALILDINSLVQRAESAEPGAEGGRDE